MWSTRMKHLMLIIYAEFGPWFCVQNQKIVDIFSIRRSENISSSIRFTTAKTLKTLNEITANTVTNNVLSFMYVIYIISSTICWRQKNSYLHTKSINNFVKINQRCSCVIFIDINLNKLIDKTHVRTFWHGGKWRSLVMNGKFVISFSGGCGGGDDVISFSSWWDSWWCCVKIFNFFEKAKNKLTFGYHRMIFEKIQMALWNPKLCMRDNTQLRFGISFIS